MSEAHGATADFAVTLSRAASETVTVEYAAIPDGTAPAGADYTATSGTLTFTAGETSKTISVPVHDDSHEDSGETFRLMLSNPSGGNVYLADAWAIGTIHNDDPVPETNAASALTASFLDLPQTHAGSAFTFKLAFSEEPHDLSYVTLRDAAFAVTHGAVTGARRLDPPSNVAWEITVAPAGNDDVTVRRGPTEDCADTSAVCTEDGRKLSNRLRTGIQGPPVEVSVADAEVTEAEDAVLAFVVTLSRAASGSLTVDYGTSDGSAQAHVDYTAASGTLTFEAGESSQTIEVSVLEDLHDEDEETLTLTLSNLSGDHVSLADAEATGTIVNSDPLGSHGAPSDAEACARIVLAAKAEG